MSLYVLLYMALMQTNSRTEIISHVTPAAFDQLYLKHAKTLLCPCSKDFVSYKAFVSAAVSYHPVCSSIFVEKQWIEALYLPNASRYHRNDFRTTASAQVSQDLPSEKPRRLIKTASI